MRHQKEIDYTIHLLKCAIRNEISGEPANDLNWDIIFSLAQNHKITSTLYYGISKLSPQIQKNLPHIEKYILSYQKNLVLDANRSYELEQLENAFLENSIDYIFLKGSVIKHYYPDTSMRRMSDIDILFRGADFKKIDKIFENLGYRILHKDAKDTAYINPINNVAIEMQPHLIDLGYKDWYDYLEQVWDRCTHDHHKYKMTLEDFYIYHIIHMAKHVKNGGIGLNHFLDIYIMRQNFKTIDWNYVQEELSNLGLQKFQRVAKELTAVWFEDKKNSTLSDAQLELLTTYIIKGGAFGNTIQHETNMVVARGDEEISVLKKIFPNTTTMVNYYGDFLHDHKYLLPIYWIRLNFNRLFRRKDGSSSSIKTLKSISKNKISQTKEFMNLCGLK